MTLTPSLILSEYTLHLQLLLNDFDKNVFNDILSFEIDCTSMPEFEQKGYEKSTELKPLILTLDGNGRNSDPAVYWFEITSKHTAKDIHHPYAQFRIQSPRAIPAFKKGFREWESKILYVGKVKNNIAGRMIIHLGYETKYQGLRLCDWRHIQGLKLKLNVIYLPTEFEPLAKVFELQLAKTLHPILGKHL